jgi:hypothetical protein
MFIMCTVKPLIRKKIKTEGVMRKKIMSCVMALVFTMSIATNVFAAESYNFGDGASGPSGITNSNANGTNTGSVPIGAQDKIDNITQIYGYAAGQMVSIVSADGSISLLSGGRLFVTLSSNLDGTYTVSGINLTGSDWDAISKMDGATEKEKLKNYLISLGIPATAMEAQPAVYDNNGNPLQITPREIKVGDEMKTIYVRSDTAAGDDGYTESDDVGYDAYVAHINRPKEDVAWLEKAASHLQNGITTGISINFGGSGGATATFLEYGQQKFTYSATLGPDGQLFKMQEFNYSATGFLTSITNYNFKITFTGDAAAGAQKYADGLADYLANHPDKTEDDYIQTLPDKDKNSDYQAYCTAHSEGNYKYEKDTTTIHIDEYGRQAYITDSKGTTTTTYHYEINGSLTQVKDLVTGTTQNFVNGQISSVWNKDGGLIQAYNYNTNGTINNVVTYNEGKAVQMEVYSQNKALMTVSLAHGDMTADQARLGYFKMKEPGKTFDDLFAMAKEYHVITMNVYAEDAKNVALMNFVLNPGGQGNAQTAQLAYDVMLKNANGIAPIGSASFSWGTGVVQKDGYYSIGDKQFKTKEELIDYLSTTTPYKDYLRDSDGKETTDKSKVDLDKSFEAMKSHGGMQDIKYTTAETADVLTVNFNVNAKGATSFSFKNDYKYNQKAANTETKMHDPAVVGTVNAYYDADGNIIEDIVAYREANPDAQIFVKINAEGINMMDGNGFQPAEGEEIMIDISSLSNEELSALAESGKGLFMGDVNKTSEGQYVMTINKNYNVEVNGKNYGGFVTGADLNAAVAEVDAQSKLAENGESKYAWMNTNTAANRALFGLGSGSYLNDWKAGWSILAGWN